MFDLFLRNGRVIDGTGQTWFRGGVGITGDEVTIVRSGEDGVEAARTIDVGESVICPGFIDMHSHSDLVLLSNPRHEIKLRQGVTTELMGMDGLSLCAILAGKAGAVALLPGGGERHASARYALGYGAGIPGPVRRKGRLQCRVHGPLMPPSGWRPWVGTTGCLPNPNWPA